MRSIGNCFGYGCLFLGGCCCYPYNSVEVGTKGIVQEYGRVIREVDEGMHYVNPLTEQLRYVNMKVQVIDLGKQNVMTSDKLSITIDSVVYYKITNPYDALYKIDDIRHAIIELSHSTLRNVIGHHTMEICLSQREKIAESIKKIVDESVHNWEVSIMSIQIKDMTIPHDIITSLSSTVIAEREAMAKIITAKADVEAAELMRQAEDILSTPAAIQIRSLEVIDRLAHNGNSKIILLPSDLKLHNIGSNLVVQEMI